MGIFRTLMRRNSALLLSGQLISTMGSIMQTTALSLFVLKTTGDVFMFASVMAVGMVPRFFGPFAGVFVDRNSRKRLIVLLDAIAGFVTLCFAIWDQYFGGLLLPCIYILVLMLAAIQTFDDPAISAIIPEIVEHKSLEEVNSASSFIMSTACIAAPALAGIIYSQSSLFIIMLINAASFFAAAALEAFIKYRPAAALHAAAQEPILKSMKEGLDTVRRNRELTLIVVISIVANLALNPIFSVGMPFIIKNVLMMSDEMFGLSQSILFIGPVIGSILAGFVLKRVDYKRMLTWILMADGALIAVMAILTAFGSLSLSLLTVFFCINITAVIVVATIVLASIAIMTALQKIVPVHLLGRVSGVDTSMSLLAIPLGQMLFGLGTSLLNPQFTLLIFAGMAMVTGLLAFLLYKPMLRRQAAQEKQQQIQG